MAHKSTSSSAPVLIDPPFGWETATNISNWHLIPFVYCLDRRCTGNKNVRCKGVPTWQHALISQEFFFSYLSPTCCIFYGKSYEEADEVWVWVGEVGRGVITCTNFSWQQRIQRSGTQTLHKSTVYKDSLHLYLYMKNSEDSFCTFWSWYWAEGSGNQPLVWNSSEEEAPW